MTKQKTTVVAASHETRDATRVDVGPFRPPFAIGPHGTFEDCRRAYRVWLWWQINRDADFRAQVAGLAGKRLAIAYRHKGYHAHCLAACADWLATQSN